MNKYIDMLSKLRIHPLFWVVIAIGVATAHFKELLILFGIVFIHELGHAFAAAYYSWRIKQVQLLPFGGVVELEEHGNKPLKEEMIVLFAGPFQHVWMIGVSIVLFQNGWLKAEWYELLLWNNMIILVFNLLPIWPLDGGKIVLNILSNWLPFLQAHRIMLYISGIVFGIMISISTIVNPTNITMWMITCFLAISMYTEWKQRQYTFIRFLLERYYGNKRNISKLTPIVVAAQEPLYNIFTQFRRGYKHSIIIQGAAREQYTLDENELLYAYFTEKRINSSVGELIG
ncbi:M50 family metallopeptidase [Bacillus sp. 165]|uniref:M50 family metallopeptidase n=1 Tax=Bacillus sp. 165 TaxID=1529117 RepID=UPI001ADC3A3F|nr:M50 family metallopeptidase [Bacillus sp. 165]MBO9130501.1 M50 family metallopeptidase [Bacillus sp. 165]